MSFFSILIIIITAIIIFSVFRLMKISQILSALLSGIAALLCSDVIMSFFGSNMPVNIYTVLFSAFGGIPFVVLLILIKTFLLY